MISCIDIAENMIQMAKIKLENYNDIEYYTGDFSEVDFEEKFDVVVSSLALHHIKTDDDKKNFYNKIYNVLKPGGVFLNSDYVLGSNDNLNRIYRREMDRFHAFKFARKGSKRKMDSKRNGRRFPSTTY